MLIDLKFILSSGYYLPTTTTITSLLVMEPSPREYDSHLTDFNCIYLANSKTVLNGLPYSKYSTTLGTTHFLIESPVRKTFDLFI